MKETSFRQRVVRSLKQYDPDAFSVCHSIENVFSRGFPDLFYINPQGRVLLIEFKSSTGKESPLQARFRQSCQKLRGAYHLRVRIELSKKAPPVLSVLETFWGSDGVVKHFFYDEFIDYLLQLGEPIHV
jgi:hypothetical protein